MIVTAQPLLSRVQVLNAARATGLLSSAQYACVERNLSPELGGPDTARALIAAGFLTPFQADRLLAGKTDGFVLGQYVILDQIGGGIASRLYQARHKTMNRLVAIKVLGAQRTRNPARRAAFQADARAAAKLTHPNVVTLLDVNQIGERVYLVLEYVEGTTLGAFVRLRGAFLVPRACEMIRQATLGLQHAHEHDQLHGQLDPDAILIGHPGGVRGEKPAVKVAGFEGGRHDDVDPGSDMADPDDYRAPELHRPGARPTVESDLYSLGCVFYFLLTGSPPVRGHTREEKAHQHLTATPVPLEMLRPDVPPRLVELVQAMMAKAPADRPSTATVLERLQPFAEADEAISRVDFTLTEGVISASFASGYLSGLIAIPPSPQTLELDDTSPWEGLENGTIDEAAEVTSNVRRPKPPPSVRGRLLGVAAVMAGLLCVGAALAFYLLVAK